MSQQHVSIVNRPFPPPHIVRQLLTFVISTALEDFRIIFERDPAARNWLEVLLCYPGLHALLLHRFGHALYKLKLPVIPRVISQLARLITGVEIHPGAQIGKGVFIDHGMGVVVGETAIIGDYALIYQGVTLGGTGKESGKRHPTLGRNVVVGAGAKVLGNIIINDNVRIGAGSVVLRDVPSDCTVVGIPGRIVYRAGSKVEPLDHAHLPDSEAKVIRMLLDRIESLEAQVKQLQYSMPAHPTNDDIHPIGPQNNSNNLNSRQKSPSSGQQQPQSITSCSLANKEIEEFLGGTGI